MNSLEKSERFNRIYGGGPIVVGSYRDQGRASKENILCLLHQWTGPIDVDLVELEREVDTEITLEPKPAEDH